MLYLNAMKHLILVLLFISVQSILFAPAQTISGKGASSVKKLYAIMFETYENNFGISVTYDPVGSGGGRRETLAQTVDFGASDAFMNDEQLATAPIDPVTGQPNIILHIPMAVLPVVPIFNFSPISLTPEKINFNGPILADIFLGNITYWNDSALQVINPDIQLPSIPITVVTRADSSGTTSIFVDYLAKVSTQWASEISQGPKGSIDWPAGFGAQGSGGVTDAVASTPGAISYVSLEYAQREDSGVGIGALYNISGVLVEANKNTIAAAANVPLPEDMRATFTNTSAIDGWPISGFTWLLFYQNQDYQGRSREQAQKTLNLVRWMLGEGQQYQEDVGNGAIVGVAKQGALYLLDTVNYGGELLGR